MPSEASPAQRGRALGNMVLVISVASSNHQGLETSASAAPFSTFAAAALLSNFPALVTACFASDFFSGLWHPLVMAWLLQKPLAQPYCACFRHPGMAHFCFLLVCRLRPRSASLRLSRQRNTILNVECAWGSEPKCCVYGLWGRRRVPRVLWAPLESTPCITKIGAIQTHRVPSSVGYPVSCGCRPLEGTPCPVGAAGRYPVCPVGAAGRYPVCPVRVILCLCTSSGK